MALVILTGIAIISVIYLVYRYSLMMNSNYWPDRGIPCVKGALPVIGHNLPILKMRQSFITLFNNFYQAYPNHSMIGYYNFQTPGLIIRDPELVKKIMLTDFINFDKNTSSLDRDLDPILSRNPFFTKGHEWKTNRSIMINGLSSKKLKLIANHIRDICCKCTKYLKEQTKQGAISINIVDEFASRFTAEVVAIAGFGINGGSFTNEPGNFGAMAKLMFQPASLYEFFQIISLFFPIIAKLLRLRFLPKKLDIFFRQVLTDVLQSRKNSSAQPEDYLQQVSDMCRKDNSEQVDEDAVATHAASLFLDGYLTSGMTLSFAAYQIAAHPHVQEKLRNEVLNIFEQYQGEITYEALQDMKYMEQVINESMRLFPALAYLGKTCTKECKITGYDGLECVVEPGMELIICAYGLQRDPRFWDNPDIFDPERFSDERKNNRHKYVFLPFGSGPRICVGMRIAMMQIKAALATLLRDYSIEIDPKTIEPLGIHPLSAIFTAPSCKLWIHIKPLIKQ